MSWLSKTIKKVGHAVSKGFKATKDAFTDSWEAIIKAPENVVNTLKGTYNAINQSGYLPAIIGTGAGAFLGGPLGAMVGAQLGGQYAQNQWNSEQARLANQWAIDTWNMQNEYNTPANQIARLRASGLNPNLFYSQGNVGNASSVGSYTAAEHDYSFSNAISAASAYAQLQNMNVTNKNLQAQTAHINAQTLNLVTETGYRQAIIDYYNRYGRFPNQSSASVLLQSVQDLTGFSSHSLRALRDNVWNEVQAIGSALSGESKEDFRSRTWKNSWKGGKK